MKIVNEKESKQSEAYFDIAMDMMDDYDEDEVQEKVIQERFYPCAGCGEPFFIAHKDLTCPYCGMDNNHDGCGEGKCEECEAVIRFA